MNTQNELNFILNDLKLSHIEEQSYTNNIVRLVMGNDLSCVISAHLYVENKLDEFLENYTNGQYEFIKLAALTYNQKVYISGYLGLGDEYIKPLAFAGNLRNSFAHNIDRKLSKNDVDNFLKTHSAQHVDEIKKLTLNFKGIDAINRLYISLIMTRLYGYLYGRVQVFKALEKHRTIKRD